ncbi:MarR family winged helix-turn-helix transcriptional regulator [Micromonospora rubida]|uniref:MarR family winged helix-turn-helix transcriptional regulator n=1 Tax=Micromonospora rubida TaxID=2697657 RepID=UPI00191C2077|nr:MarR family transcriptional regulator [Micromonospora rubida]
MNDVKLSTGLPETVTFQLGTLGALIAERFANEIAVYALKPKHVGLLTALIHAGAASQQELAAKLMVAPSLVVSLADHLEQLEAISRVRDPGDRRRQILKLTDEGARLLTRCENIARTIDDDLLGPLPGRQRTALRHALKALAAQKGLPITSSRKDAT